METALRRRLDAVIALMTGIVLLLLVLVARRTADAVVALAGVCVFGVLAVMAYRQTEMYLASE